MRFVEFTDFEKIKGWDEEMYDAFGKAFKVRRTQAVLCRPSIRRLTFTRSPAQTQSAISKEIKIEQKRIDKLKSQIGGDVASTSKTSVKKENKAAKSRSRATSVSSGSASKRGADSKM